MRRTEQDNSSVRQNPAPPTVHVARTFRYACSSSAQFAVKRALPQSLGARWRILDLVNDFPVREDKHRLVLRVVGLADQR